MTASAGTKFLLCLLTATLLTVLPSRKGHSQVTQKGVWTDPSDATIPPVFHFQGEYVGQVDGGEKLGAQVIALNEELFVQVVIYPGGLPGGGWDETNKILLDGSRDEENEDAISLVAAQGKRKYMDGRPEGFSAVREFPPTGHQQWNGKLSAGMIAGKTHQGKAFKLKKIERQSDTLGAKPPKNAVVLFDGSSLEHFEGGRLDEKTKILHTDAKNVRSKGSFQAYSVHLEFRTPFRPKSRGQGRGNSGFYQTNGQEVQVLDSFGLEGLKNECGGLYGRADCRINMCLPPLTWQTFDVDLLPDPDDPKSATLTVHHNGVVIHDKVPTRLGGGRFTLQGHGNLLQYRNIWLVEHPTATNK